MTNKFSSGIVHVISWAILFLSSLSTTVHAAEARERISINKNWRFAIGHATDPGKDFNHATGYFSYLAKTGFGDGPASSAFDDRGWRIINLPHDWAVEMPFDGKASASHGYKTVGPGFPENSVGWYRHKFAIPESDLGRRIRVEFDGIQRASRVFVNGFLVGDETHGNTGQSYDVSAYLNYGGENVVVVRADVFMEAGWYYEGAGINRHAYLLKTSPVHVERYGTAITTHFENNNPEGAITEIKSAAVNINTTLINEQENSATEILAPVNLQRIQTIVDAKGNVVATSKPESNSLKTGESITVSDSLTVTNPVLWSLENPHLYKLVTRLQDSDGKTLDHYETSFGIRSVRFDANEGFFLNGKHIKLKGTNNHEDHAGVGTALPDSLIEFRLQQLKAMGSNAYRTSHAPPSPSMLEAADRMGILVIDENRLMGTNALHRQHLEEMIKRDRNHPSVIIWSLGNEEWAIEGNIKGARIASSMQSFARDLDPSRINTVAISGGWGGISSTIGAAGVNYIKQANTDKQHADYPWQILIGTEETTTQQTRGIYIDDKAQAHLAPSLNGTSGGNAEIGWQHYAARPFLAGVFYWTGFDYRGETTPYYYPAISSQFGILDTCGFPKDGFYYLKSWWTKEPVLHVFPHWNWPGREGQPIEVTVNSNSEEVELLLNKISLGKKIMPVNGHLSWQVPYSAGELVARSFNKGNQIMETRVATTDKPAAIKLDAHKTAIRADDSDVSVITVSVTDKAGRIVPVANNNIRFAIEGAGKIIGVGNGNPSSHEADTQVESATSQTLGIWKAPNPADSKTPVVFEVTFDRPALIPNGQISLLLNALGEMQTATLNGVVLYNDAVPEKARTQIAIDSKTLRATGNTLRLVAAPFKVWRDRDGLFQFHPATLKIATPAAPYQRQVFNGLAQVIVQSNDQAGIIKLTATGNGLTPAIIKIATKK